MELVTTLQNSEQEIVGEALSNLEKLHVHHYESAGQRFTRSALDDLFELVVTAIDHRDLAGVIQFAEGIAENRFSAGFDIAEVQSAFNELETAMWRRVVATEAPGDLPEAVGLLSTVFGVAKDALARRYVSLASQKRVPSLDLSALFQGTGS
jgi:hypothetical protein